VKLLKSGSVKDLYEVDENTIIFEFSDRISVFDKLIPTEIPHKGETLCRTAVYWFEKVKNMNIKTHFLEYIPPKSIKVKKVRVIPDYSKLTPATQNYLIPLEFISRYYVAGSLYDRLITGKLSPEDIGFSRSHNVKYGEELPEPFFEVSTKLERVDRLLTKEEALNISGLTEEEYGHIIKVISKIDDLINKSVYERGLIHVDGKKEFAFDENRKLMIVDVFGTADEDRFWDKELYEKGEFVDKSKELVRQYYRRIGYKDELYKARESGEPEPDIPPLPADVVSEVSKTYIELFERITGRKFG
jgi:phosphoribosylaminoimidazole-succinocarboxamide synthase